MTEIEYKVGDATAPEGQGSKVIVHVCNDIGGWGRGFVVALSKRWPEPESSYRAWYKDGESFRLGAVQFVQVEEELWVANLIGQHKLRRQGGQPPIRYEAIEEGLTEVSRWAQKQGASVHMPRIGCGLAGGSWDEIEPILQRTLLEQNIPISVYDLG